MDLKHPTAFDDAAVAELFHRVDKDGSGTVDFQEFIDLVYVELQERIGLDHAVYGVPVYKLRRRPETFRAPANVFALGADPFRQLLGLEAAGRRRRARAHTTRRIEALSRPMSVAASVETKMFRIRSTWSNSNGFGERLPRPRDLA